MVILTITASRLTTRPMPRVMLSSGLTGKEVGYALISTIFRSSCVLCKEVLPFVNATVLGLT